VHFAHGDKGAIINEEAIDLTQLHNIPPLYNKDSEILILGSFPSVKSREQQFFYGHPQNRFWKVISAVFNCETPVTIPEKKGFLYAHGIALWDVISSCEIKGSSDSSIENVIPNDIGIILRNSDVRKIYTNGNTSSELYRKFIYPRTGIESIKLPSTSPANASWSLEKLIDTWQIINFQAQS